MIAKIQMRQVASYDATGVDIDTDKKMNFFFGYNGCGKSTIARYLRDLSLPSTEHNAEFDQCSQIGYNPSTETILVYNEDFRRENFIIKDEQRGIFSLNGTNAAIDKQIEEINEYVESLQKHLQSVKNRETQLNAKKTQKQRRLEDDVFNKRNIFSSCRLADLPYGGRKATFLQHIKESLSHTTALKTLPDLMSEYQRVYGNGVKNIPFAVDVNAFQVLIDSEADLSNLLGEVIIGNNDVDIAGLINQLQMSNWVVQGLPYLDQSGDKCPFCQQPLTDKTSIQHQFEQFFDASYKDKMEALKDKADNYMAGLNAQIIVLESIESLFNPQNIVSSLHADLIRFRDTLLQIINEKKERPNERKSMASLSQYISRLNDVKSQVEANNQDFTNLSSLKTQWITDVQVYIAEDSRTAIERHDAWEQELDSIIELNGASQTSIGARIAYQIRRLDELRKQTVNTADAVVNMGKILKNVGFTGFEIKEKPIAGTASPTYYLKRQGSTSTKVYQTLSEGEKTFISFLYFYELCLGTADLSAGASKKKIIVIDDPVSSLDSKVMFVITTLIHQLAKYKYQKGQPTADKKIFANPTIEQLFILTHNYYFYKEVSLDKRPIVTNYRHHVIEKVNNCSRITSSDKRTIKNDYLMMWECLKQFKANIGTDKSQNVMIANTMRRVIDTYMDFIGYKKGDTTTVTWSSLGSFAEGTPEYVVESAFISFINDDSHGMAVFDDMYYANIIHQEPSVIFTVFKELFKQIGRNHYEMMMDDVYVN